MVLWGKLGRGDEHTDVAGAGLWPLKAVCLWQVAKCVAIGRGKREAQTLALPGCWDPASSWHSEPWLPKLTLYLCEVQQ